MIDLKRAKYARAMHALAMGQYDTGWPLYESRTELPGFAKPALAFPEWKGESLNGKCLVVWPEQGLGDKIMFARYLPRLPSNTIVLCEPALERLFRTNFDVTVVVASGKTRFPDPDAWVFYGSLPYRLGQSAVPGAPYLSAKASKSASRIGICTRGNPIHPNDANRSLPSGEAARLLSLPGAMSLHVDDTRARDLMATAQIMAGLDLIITVDTAVAHLAGAMGKPVWILLPSTGLDWRWGKSGVDTAWYPSARLYRQATGQSWAAVIDRVCSDVDGRTPA